MGLSGTRLVRTCGSLPKFLQLFALGAVKLRFLDHDVSFYFMV
jgi:hypothetical protein